MILDELPANSRANHFLARENKSVHSVHNSRSRRGSKKAKAPTPHSIFRQKTSDHASNMPEQEDKVIYNTWIEAPAEVNSLPGINIPIKEPYASGKAMDSSRKPLDAHRDKVKDYEEILQDSPVAAHPLPYIENFTKLKAFVDTKDLESETVEDMIQNLDELVKQAGHFKRANHKRGVSVIQDQPLMNQKRKFFHQASLLMDSNTDFDSLFGTETEKPTSTKNFTKLDENIIRRSFSVNKDTTSNLSKTLRNTERSQVRSFTTQIGMTKSKKRNIKMYRVYFFNSKLYLDIPINTYLTVGEVIKQIIEEYMQNKNIDHTLLKYPKDVEAYELRMLDDEDAESLDDQDAHMPDFSLPPLEKNRVFLSLGLEKGVAFVENSDYQPPVAAAADKSSVNTAQILEGFAKRNKKIIVTIIGKEEQFTQKLPIDPAKKIRDLYPMLAVRIKKISERHHKFRLYREVKETNDFDEEEDEDDDEDILDDNLPIRSLKAYISGSLTLELIRKKFADEAPNDPLFLKNSLFGNVEVQSIGQSFTQGNEAMASHYEEFEVTKTTGKGRIRQRILGIDAVKIQNLIKQFKEQHTGLATIFSTLFYTKIAPKHPERRMSEVVEAKIIDGNRFKIQYLVDRNRLKLVEYEANDAKVAHKIVSKIQYLKSLEKKKKQQRGLYSGDFDRLVQRE